MQARETMKIAARMPKPRWPLVEIEKPAELYVELEHIIAFATQHWRNRTGSVGTRDPQDQPKVVHLTMGLHNQPIDFEGHDATHLEPGRCATPERGHMRSRLLRASLGRKSLGHGFRMPTKGRTVQTFEVDDFLLMECPLLNDMYRKAVNHRLPQRRVDLGYLGRHPELFTAVESLMKLRWLARVHCALQSFAGTRCSLVRFLKGVLVDSSGVHDQPHLPMPYYEIVVESLRQTMGQAWPLFLSYVSRHDRRAAPEGDVLHSAAVVEQLVDDIWISWVAQQDVQCMPTQAVMEELSYFGMRQPKVRECYNDLLSWGMAKPQTKGRYERAARQEASHLALSLDLPFSRRSWQHSQEEILDMARNIAAHPRTFNRGVRERVVEVHLDTSVHYSTTGALCSSFARECNAEALAKFQDFSVSPRDTGRLAPLKLQAWRDNKAPRLVGREVRFPDTGRWHARFLSDKDGDKPLLDSTASPGSTRGPKVSVRIV